jgi:AcrR family transcriptional regulator
MGPAGSPARTTRRQAESARRRQRIVEAARRCFGASGFAGATVEAIASEAGVSNGLLYQFFRNKDHLFEVVVDELIRDWVRAMVGGEEREGAGDALEAMLRRSVSFCRSHPLLPAILTRDHLLELARTSDVASRRVQAHRAHVAALLERGIASGEFRADLDVPAVADVVSQLQVDYSTRAYRRDPLHPAHPTLIDAVARFIRDALRR